MDDDEKEMIERLLDRTLAEADRSSCIDVLEVLLSLEALEPLLKLVKDESEQIALRERAAAAISSIGSEYLRDRLLQMAQSEALEVRYLASVALGVEGRRGHVS